MITHHDDEEIQRAASTLISDGLDLAELGGFIAKRYGYRRITISGPHQSRCDDRKEGIWIYTYDELSRVRVNPFLELNEDQYFEHANPEFPSNLIDYIVNAICAWEDWWDVFEQEEHESSQC